MSGSPVPRVPRTTREHAVAVAHEVGFNPVFAQVETFQVLVGHPELAGRLSNLMDVFQHDPALDPRLRELVFMRLAWTTRCPVLWTLHWHHAMKHYDMSAEDLLGMRAGATHPGLSARERAALRFTDELVAAGTASDTTWAATAAEFDDDPRTMIVLTTMVNAYRMMTGIVNTLGVPIDDLEPWPPDGMEPPLPAWATTAASAGERAGEGKTS